MLTYLVLLPKANERPLSGEKDDEKEGKRPASVKSGRVGNGFGYVVL